ncbi:bifunctional adenosylcobinamide kinase/adenosylcobinamide-phosphate guanylyltransferase [Amycolatopsis sp. BJA-103]|uniref:bifunctional adenosylcobinamide kinase/adenosylcobinamide-phosphate guanylyltransferase n=1 Tax=unclassified Amycolatopsis TaxID=2618356 RepID=UPI000C7868A8|nr:bifunctional adenosylcobinamide kinase/adenosylcobinamide-phosphate guanylyltransferase [Amycolatopsis sp. BJA-103]AUI56868.1 adenosylcobinamide kinase/adenosylcobinamide phosphate guanyltransferase [Amycolatopsis sp. BJA-103]PNE13512.1 adenosylcobinamide kinase/adenosylcobinamide phosphate guanyltransferase [Amycolatopsis sp. BJA-103]
MTKLTHRLARVLETLARALRRYSRDDGKVLILGGVRSGKSHHAERLASRHPHLTYLAPGLPPSADDPEWAARVAAHRARRPSTWKTIETTDLATVLRTATHPLLIDCLGTWIARVLDEVGAWEQRKGWERRLDDRLEDFLAAWAQADVPVIAVSNEVGSGVVPATVSGRVFRDVLGALNNRVSAVSDRTVLVVAGRMLDLP